MLLIGLAQSVGAQTTMIVNTIKGLQKMYWNNHLLTGVMTDSTFNSATHQTVPTSKAVKEYFMSFTGGTGAAQLYENLGTVSGSTISTSTAIPATGREWRVNLYRTGIRMVYGVDYTISGSTITLALSADAEQFTLIVTP